MTKGEKKKEEEGQEQKRKRGGIKFVSVINGSVQVHTRTKNWRVQEFTLFTLSMCVNVYVYVCVCVHLLTSLRSKRK